MGLAAAALLSDDGREHGWRFLHAQFVASRAAIEQHPPALYRALLHTGITHTAQRRAASSKRGAAMRMEFGMW